MQADTDSNSSAADEASSSSHGCFERKAFSRNYSFEDYRSSMSASWSAGDLKDSPRDLVLDVVSRGLTWNTVGNIVLITFFSAPGIPGYLCMQLGSWGRKITNE